MEHELNTEETKLSRIGSSTWIARSSLIFLYLSAIISANLLIVKFGPRISILNALLFIGLDLSSRDRLHEAWEGRGLVYKMGLLISAGSLLSWAMNRNAAPIALASFVAFAISASVDSFIYYLLRDKAYLVKVNGSNVVSALFDSILFPWIAFGSVMPWITAGQFIAKVAGGFIWGLILKKTKTRGE